MTVSDIIASSTIELVGMALLIWGYANKDKVIAWEYKHLWNPLKKWVRNTLINNKRFMAWLNKPQKHGKPDAEWITGQIKVFGDVWR